MHRRSFVQHAALFLRMEGPLKGKMGWSETSCPADLWLGECRKRHSQDLAYSSLRDAEVGATFRKGLVSSHSPAATRASLQLLPSFLFRTRRPRWRVRRCFHILPNPLHQAAAVRRPVVKSPRDSDNKRPSGFLLFFYRDKRAFSFLLLSFVPRLATALTPPADTCSWVRPAPYGHVR